MILQYEMISQYEIQISKKRKKFKKEMQISMKLLSELSVKRLFVKQPLAAFTCNSKGD